MASRLESAILALKAALEVNYATTVYPPEVVQPTLFWPDPKVLDPSVKTLYLIRMREEAGGYGPSPCSVTEVLEVFILPARRHPSPTENPFKEDPPRWKVSADLVADVKEKIRRNPKLATEAEPTGTVIEALDGPVVTDYERWLPGWVIPELRFTMRYRYEQSGR